MPTLAKPIKCSDRCDHYMVKGDDGVWRINYRGGATGRLPLAADMADQSASAPALSPLAHNVTHALSAGSASRLLSISSLSCVDTIQKLKEREAAAKAMAQLVGRGAAPSTYTSSSREAEASQQSGGEAAPEPMGVDLTSDSADELQLSGLEPSAVNDAAAPAPEPRDAVDLTQSTQSSDRTVLTPSTPPIAGRSAGQPRHTEPQRKRCCSGGWQLVC